MQRLLTSLSIVFALVAPIAVSTTSCAGNNPQGEGEGEGTPAGEGEGTAAGEGEGAAGEGEGSAGEGEGSAGEGEGSAGEGEGEGEGAPPADEAGGVDNPVDVDVSGGTITENINVDPDTDTDCYRFTLPNDAVLEVSFVGPGCQNFDTEPLVEVFDATNTASNIAEADNSGSPQCASLVQQVAAGQYIVCAESSFDPVDNGTLTITIGTLLNEGDVCDPASTTAVCNAGNGDACLDDGAGGHACANASSAVCAAAVEWAAPDTQATPSGPDATRGSCDGDFTGSEPESVLHYLTQNHSEVSIKAFGADTVYVRGTCTTPASELGCQQSTNPEVVLSDVNAGTDLFIFSEAAAGTLTIVTVQERAIASSEVDTSDLSASTTTFTRFASDCSVSTDTVPFDHYTVTNTGGDPATVKFETTSATDPTQCPFDSFLNVLAAGTDPTQATAAQCVVANDDGGVGNCSLVETTIDPGASVEVIVSTFASDTTDGPYALHVTSFNSAVSVVKD